MGYLSEISRDSQELLARVLTGLEWLKLIVGYKERYLEWGKHFGRVEQTFKLSEDIPVNCKNSYHAPEF